MGMLFLPLDSEERKRRRSRLYELVNNSRLAKLIDIPVPVSVRGAEWFLDAGFCDPGKLKIKAFFPSPDLGVCSAKIFPVVQLHRLCHGRQPCLWRQSGIYQAFSEPLAFCLMLSWPLRIHLRRGPFYFFSVKKVGTNEMPNSRTIIFPR